MSMARFVVGALLASSALVACSAPPTAAETEAKLKAATLKVTNSAANASVIVSDQVQTASRWVWNATVNGTAFKCDVDTFFELPACEPVQQPGA